MLDDLFKLPSGEANAEARHVVVPLYMPLAIPMSVAEAMKTISGAVADRVSRGDAEFVALAQGTMNPPGEKPTPLQLVLLYGKFADGEPKDYFVFDTLAAELDMAVMTDGHGRRHFHADWLTEPVLETPALPPDEAIALWMAGFLNWNECHPGMYRLRYCRIHD